MKKPNATFLSDPLQRKRLLYATGGTVVVLAALWLAWLSPLREENDALRQSAEQLRQANEQGRKKLAKGQGLQEELEKLLGQGGADASQAAPRASDPFQAAGALGERFGALNRDELSVKTYQVVSTKDGEGLKETSITYNLSASIGGLYAFLEEMDRIRSTVSLQQLEIRKATMRRGPDLDVKATVIALIEPGRS